MSVLKDNEWKLINETLLALYTIDDLKMFMEKFLAFIKVLIPYDTATFTLSEKDNRKLVLEDAIFNGYLQADTIREYFDVYYDTDYALSAFNYSKSIVYKDTELLEEKLRKKTRFYKEFLEPQNIPFCGGIIISKDNKLLGSVALFRSAELGDLNNRDIYILDFFKDHITNILYKLLNHHVDNPATVNNYESLQFIKDAHFSRREMEVLKFLIEGYSNADIAEELMISISTVKKHIYNIFTKLSINNRTQLIKLLNNQ